ncbi:hypothetical protein GF359_09750 [candidate division WOR-3 bacterium]|uniref:Uncharacterized protein n=1 Tax=candidate division WOR-3 bacterium TaxID=2052148 RepID=A0A9D5KAV1_UNCW3|nr:hypothetical protein [candidate division WOR-3 bacterium]MBD3365483.1 hypothetical protein [candidate division WOR-3 bacterium]
MQEKQTKEGILRIYAVLCLLITLPGCTPKGLKPPKESKITAYYTRSATVTVEGEMGTVPPWSEVVVEDMVGTEAARVIADRNGSFNINFCAGSWARENFENCTYQGDLSSGDSIKVYYVDMGMTGPPLILTIR